MARSHATINQWIREQEARLGIESPKSGESEPTLPTVAVYPSPYVIERLAHAAADARMAADPVHDAMCERLDAELAEILANGGNSNI